MSKPNVEDIYQLSPGQQGMLAVILLAGSGSDLYFDQSVLTLAGELDTDAWHRAWQRVLDRHAALRTLFLWERQGEPLQVVRRQVELPWQELDWRGLPAAEQEARLQDFLREDRGRGFDLGTPPLMRLALIRWDDAAWKQVWSFHHMIIDGWSVSRVLAEAVTIYAALREGREPELAAPRSYRDYIAWLRRQDMARAEAFWRGALAGFDEPTPLPYDGTGNGAAGSGREVSWIPPAEADALSSLARRYQLTLNTVFQGAWGSLLARGTDRGDVVFGSVVSGRPPEVEGIESVVGFFINVLPVRVRLGSEAVGTALVDLQSRQVEQRDFEHCPLETIQAWSDLPRGSRQIETLLLYQNFPLDPLQEAAALPGFRILGGGGKGASHYPVCLAIAPRAGGLDLTLDYHERRLDAAAARQLLAQLRTLLAAFVARPETPMAELPLLTGEEQRELLAWAAGPVGRPADACIHTLVAEQAARTPEAPAVEAGGRVLSYCELAERAGQLARRLQRLGVGPESVVGLCVERSPEMIVGMLGVLQAGGAYLPLDPVYPRERLALMVEDSGARVLLTREGLAGSLPTAGREVVLFDAEDSVEGGTPVATQSLPGNGAYVIYTSGSTGRPKGVLVSHATLVGYVREAAEDARIGPGDRVLQFASMSFDTSAEEIYPCLTRGATLVLRDDAMAGTPESFLGEVERLGITVLDLPTAYWHELVDGMAANGLGWPERARLVILGGEQVRADRLDAWRERVGERTRLLNTYGPTEATIVTTRRELDGPRDFPAEVPIGRPIPGARAHVVSRCLELLPAGLDGELVLGGAGLARGYLGRPDLTAERFVPDPFAASPGERLYRTGDLARPLRSGELEHRGRIDHQVKVRGFRVELGEIEAALRRLSGVREAAVVVREERIVAYVVPGGETVPTSAGLRAGLKEVLPDYMLPAVIVLLEALPLTASGKIDRRALPAPSAAGSGEAGLAAPRTPVEELVAGIWADLLKAARIAPHDSFFDLGGHSLLAARVLSRVRAVFGVELPFRAVFDEPTLAGFAALVERVLQGGDGPAAAPPLVPVPRGGHLPVSLSQQRLWFLDQLEPGSSAYNLANAVRLEGPLDVAVLAAALSGIARRHESLRTTFGEEDGEPRLVIAEPASLPLPVVDLAGLPAGPREAEARRIATAEARRPYDLVRGPLVRVALLRLEEGEHALLSGMHHIVSDGWSLGIFVREMGALYRALLAGAPAALPDLPVQYADFAAWQRQQLRGAVLEERLAWWKRQLAGAPQVAELPLDRPRPPVQSYRGGRADLMLGSDLGDRLEAVTRRLGVTPFMTLLAGFSALLARYGGQDDLVVGTPIANRDRVEVEDLIGFFANTLALRVDLSGDPGFGGLAHRVREGALGAYAHQDVPFERLVDELRPERDLSHAPVFQVMLVLLNLPPSRLDLAGLTLTPLDFESGRTQFDLSLFLYPLRDGSQLARLEYAADLFDAGTAERLLGHLRTLLEGAVANPDTAVSRLPLLAAAEREQLAAWDAATQPGGHSGLLHGLFEAQARRTPEALALVAGPEALTYAELEERSARLAARLSALGAGPETAVAVCLERTADLIVTLLAVLRAGAFYVPLDPRYPAERLRFLIEDSGARILVTRSGLAEDLPREPRWLLLDRTDQTDPSDRSDLQATPQSLAYLIYTSGSTGRPKAVAIAHRSAVEFAFWARDAFSAGELRGVLASTAVTFDLSVFEIFVPLAWGGTVVLAENALELPAVASALPEGVEITLVNTVPSALAELLREGGLPASVRTINLAGEALPRWLADRAYARPGTERLCNLYGPSEDTTYSTWTVVERSAGRQPSIGRPVHGTHAYVLDPGLERLPVGLIGELYLSGAGLARGYLGRPELTAARFLPDPFAAEGARMYRTGDRARLRPDGELEYLGRLDHQVKVRGYRIELGEVEAALAAQPGVESAVVLAREDVPGERRLVAYVVASGVEPAVADLRLGLQQTLPEPYLPSAFVFLDAFPLTAHGKVDRRALPAPDGARPAGTEFVAPRNPVEEALAAVWAEVLRRDAVGIHDNFFELGGDSIRTIQVVARSRKRGIRLTPRQLFQNQTIAELAAVAEVDLPGDASPEIAPVALLDPAELAGLDGLDVEDLYPLSPGQQGMLMVVLLSGESEVYFDRSQMTLGGELDPALWRRAWQRVVDRHPSLRTLFVWEGRERPLQVVCRQAELPWQEIDWSGLPPAEREEKLEDFLRQDTARGFDLGAAPLMRFALIRWEAEAWKMIWSFHHLIIDGWSLSRVFGEAVAVYAALREGREPVLEAPRSYRDYVAWLQRQNLERAEAFWRGTLAGFDEPTPLPYDGTGSGSGSGREMDWLPPAEADALSALARRSQLTLNTLFQGAWGSLLARGTGRDDVIFGSVVSGRPGEVDGIESVVGFFINVLPVRVTAGEEAVVPALAQLQGRQFEQRDFEYCPLESIQAWSGLPRGARLIETLLVFQNFPLNPLEMTSLPGFRILGSHGKGATHYPITLYVGPRDGGLDMALDYHAGRLDAGSARRLLVQLRTLLTAFVARPEARLAELPLLTAAERGELLALAAGPATRPADVCIHTLFEEQAARTPEAPAVEAGGEILTYRELAERAGRVARRLCGLGVGPEAVVGLCVERSPDMVVGMLGVLKAGGTYLPLDPVYPRERLAFMLEDSGARVLLTQERLTGSLPAAGLEVALLDRDEPAMATPEPLPLPGNGAYIIYTSGSTGRPKGVLVPHSALVSYVRGAGEDAGIRAGDRVLQFASMSFDTSAEEIYPCLTHGATLVLRDDAMVGPPEVFLREAGRLGITVLDLPTAFWHGLVGGLEEGLEWPDRVRLVILGGEQARADRLDVWRERVGERCRLLNTYGPTEATIVATRRELAGPRDFPNEVPIGRPVPGARAYVASRRLDLLPAGLDGELALGGAGLARGYLGRPDLTAERFVPDPFSGEAGARLYRSGDLARLLPAGELEFRGRTDHQVKVRGFRIELGEIEAALRALPAVRDAVVLARGERLVAYVVPAAAAPSVSELRQELKAKLPEHMIPGIFITLDALPLTPSGKVDRRALPDPAQDRPDLDGEYVAPRNPVEEVLALLWSEILKVDQVGVHDNFFQLGGHSLLVAQLASRVRQSLNVELPMLTIFSTPTIAELAEAVDRESRRKEHTELPPIRRAPRDRPIPLTFPQERIWFLNQLVQNNLAYNFQMTVWMRGELDFPALEASIGEIVRRHEIFRTTFPDVGGQPSQVIHPFTSFELPLIDLSALPEALVEPESERLIFEDTQRHVDVARLPLIRWTLLRLAADHHELVQVEHHFVHDGWSMAVFLRELQALYAAFRDRRPSPLPELPIQFADFATWQREWMQGEVMERHLEHWCKRLEGCPPVLDLPTDHPRPRVTSFRGDRICVYLTDELYDALRRMSRQQGFTLYMTMLSGFSLLLHRYTGQADIPVGAGVANRRVREAEVLIGMIVNTMVLRNNLAGDPTFRELLHRVRGVTLDAYAFQDMPFERLVERLQPERDPSRNPLFQVMFSFHDSAVPDLDFPGLQSRFIVRNNRSAKTDINVIVAPRAEQRNSAAAAADDRAIVIWEYSADLFERATMSRMVSHYLAVLAAAATEPGRPISELSLLSDSERQEIVAGWNDTRRDYPREAGLAELFAHQAERSPQAVAVAYGEDRITYADLLHQARVLAARLRALGVRRGDLAGLCTERSVAMVVGMVGILEAGAAYVSLDPSYPDERLAFMLDDLRQAQERPPVVVTAGMVPPAVLASGLPVADLVVVSQLGDAEAMAALAPAGASDDLAYVIYTSGSTGRPKGVAVPQRAVARLVLGTDYVDLGPDDRIAQASNASFDAATFEVWGALLNGGAVVGVPREVALAPEAFADFLRRERITTLFLTTALFNQMVRETPGCFGTLRQVLFGGEAVDPRAVADLLRHRPPARLLHVYGPTESTTFTSWELVREVTPWAPTVPIGQPIANTRIHVVDGYGTPAPIGVYGELHVGGDGLAHGYLNRPELTAERFVPDPFGGLAGEPGSRLYRTGDLVRYLPDGRIEFLGRNDFQVKIRGFRIELPEVEAVITEHPEVREAAALAREDRAGERRLVAYVVPAPDTDGAGLPDALRGFMERRVPAYMVPSAFVVLPALPLTPNGKLDRRALPAPDEVRDEASYVAPRTAVEEIVAGIWSEVLGVERVGVRDDFFVLGGHSLSAARVLSRVRDALSVHLPLVVIFETPTVEGMAEAIAAIAQPVKTVSSEEEAFLAAATELSDTDLDALLVQMMAEGGNA